MPDDFSDSRRRFLGYAIGGVAGAITLGYAIPLINYVVEPSLVKEQPEWSKVGYIREIEPDSPGSLNFLALTKAGWMEKKVERDVWVVRHGDDTVTVFSPVCPHLGCGYRWDPADRKFKCPCHASVFGIDGRVQGGPAPRDLDTLPSKVEGGILYVKYEKFRLGISEKVEA